MPQVVAAVGWAIAGGSVSAAAVSFGFFLMKAATFIGYGLLIGGAYAIQQRAKRKARDKYNASQVDRLQNVPSNVNPRELVLGRVRKGGTVVFRDSCGPHKEKFVMVVALADHKIAGVDKYYLNEAEVTLDANGYVSTAPYGSSRRVNNTATQPLRWNSSIDDYLPLNSTNYPPPSATSSAISGTLVGPFYTSVNTSSDNSETVVGYSWQTEVTSSVARIRLLDGSQTTADARLMELFPGVWTANHKLLGVAYAVLEFDYNETAFPNGLPNFTATIRGAEVYDPRTGLTAFSENPALHARHIVTHPRFGKRASLTAREDARIIAAANACDTSYTPSGGTATQLYKSAVVFPYGGRAADALDDICQGMCGMWAYAGGEFFIKAGVYTAPVKTLQASDLLTVQRDSQGGSTSKAISIVTHKARADKANSATAKIYDADADYKENTTPPVKNATAITKDGLELPVELSLPTVSSAAQAQVVCNYVLKDSVDALAVNASFKLSAYELELFDNIALDFPRYGWSNKVFTVLGKTFSPTGSIELSLRETSPELFNPQVYANSTGYAKNTNLIEPWDINPPSSLVLRSGTSELLLQGDGSIVTRVRVTWPEITDERIRQGGHVEVRWRDLASDIWSTVTVPGVENSAFLLGAVDGATILVMARTRTQLAVSDWSLQQTHTVLGKSEPPAAVTSPTAAMSGQKLELSWANNTELDLAGYEIRLSDSGWGSAGEVYRGPATSVSVSPIGNTTVWYVKAFDRTGNYSAAAATVSFTKATIPSPVGLVTSVVSNQLQLTWSAPTVQFGIQGFEVRASDSGWGSSGELYRGPATFSAVEPAAPGTSRTWFVRAIDTLGAYSATSASVSYVTPAVAQASALSHVFADTSLTAATITLSWQDAAPLFGLSSYELEFNGTTITVRANTVTVPANWIGNRNFSLKTVDRYGLKSAPLVYAVTKLPPNPAIGFRSQVIDNNVYLYWQTPAKTSLPIAHSRLRKGATWETAEELGTQDGEFATRFELVGGEYTYWVAIVDTDGYESTPISLTTAVTQPPGFIFLGEQLSNFSGTKSNAIVDGGALTLPVNTAETFAQHFTTRGWTKPSDQIAAGFPIFIQPGTSSGFYEEVFDFGTVVASSSVTVSAAGRALSGNPTLFQTVSVSDDLTDWAVYGGFSQVFATNFRYVRVRFEVSQNVPGALYKLEQVLVRLDTKTFTDSGTVQALATDTDGTIVNFNFEFLDVASINPSVNATSARTATYAFRDEVKDATYTVSGNVATLSFSSVHELVVGQAVRIAPTSGTLPRGVYTISQVVSTTSYRVNVTTANTSGSCATYPNSFRVFVHDKDGNRQTNTVSWIVRGS